MTNRMKYKDFCKTQFDENSKELLPKGIEAQKALEILAEHFLGDYIITYPGTQTQWNAEVTAQILYQYPNKKISRRMA